MLLKALLPFARCTHNDACCMGRSLQAQQGNALNQKFAAFKGKSGILMAVHPAGFLCEAEAW